MTKLSSLTHAKVAFLVVLQPVNGTPHERHPLAEAIEWAAILTTIALEMVVPGIVGQWLDRRLGTQYLVLAGFAFGLVLGLWHLIQVTKTKPDRSEKTTSLNSSESSRSSDRSDWAEKLEQPDTSHESDKSDTSELP